MVFPGAKRKYNNEPHPEFLEVIDLTSSSPPVRKRSREPQYKRSDSDVQVLSNPFQESRVEPNVFDQEFEFDGADVLEELYSQVLSNPSQETQLDFDDDGGFDQEFDGADVLDELYSNYELYGAYYISIPIMACPRIQYEYSSVPGVLHTKIVGVQYYRGDACPGERVMLRRVPDNKYDRNAVQVTDVMAQQIGHLPKLVAGKLAPYMVGAYLKGT
jgi:hypothetical protein